MQMIRTELEIPGDVTVRLEPNRVWIGTEQAEAELHAGFEATGQYSIRSTDPDPCMARTYVRLLENLIHGVRTGWTQTLVLSGTGYRSEILGNRIRLYLGYSHPREIEIPERVQATQTRTEIVLRSVYRDLLGDFASRIVRMRPHNPYSGKGVLVKGREYPRKEVRKKR